MTDKTRTAEQPVLYPHQADKLVFHAKIPRGLRDEFNTVGWRGSFDSPFTLALFWLMSQDDEGVTRALAAYRVWLKTREIQHKHRDAEMVRFTCRVPDRLMNWFSRWTDPTPASRALYAGAAMAGMMMAPAVQARPYYTECVERYKPYASGPDRKTHAMIDADDRFNDWWESVVCRESLSSIYAQAGEACPYINPLEPPPCEQEAVQRGLDPAADHDQRPDTLSEDEWDRWKLLRSDTLARREHGDAVTQQPEPNDAICPAMAALIKAASLYSEEYLQDLADVLYEHRPNRRDGGRPERDKPRSIPEKENKKAGNDTPWEYRVNKDDDDQVEPADWWKLSWWRDQSKDTNSEGG